MFGSVQDADDALQDTLAGAWRGLAGFEGRSSLRTWLYRIATNACLRLAARRRPRLLSADYGPPPTDVYDLGDPVSEPVWLEPGTPFRLSAINVVTLRGGRIAELAGFLDPAVHRRFGLSPELDVSP